MKTKLFVETNWSAGVAIEEIERKGLSKAVEVTIIENGEHPLLDAFISDCKTMPEDTVKNFLNDNGYIVLRKLPS